MKRIIISLKDNPYDPFTQEDQWWAYDIGPKGYHTYEIIDRYHQYLTDEDRARFPGLEDVEIAEQLFLADHYMTHEQRTSAN